MATDLIFNRNTDNYVFTGSRLRAPPSKALRLSVADNAGAYIDVSTNGTIDISAQAGVFVNGLRVVTTSSGATTSLTGLQLSQNLDVSGTILTDGGIQIGVDYFNRGGKIYKSNNPFELVIDPYGLDASTNLTDASGIVTIMGDAQIAGDLSVNAVSRLNSATFNGVITGNSTATFNGIISANSSINIAGDLSANGATTLNTTTIAGSLTATSNVSVGGELQIGSGVNGGKIYKSLNPYELVIDPFGIDPSNNISDASGQVTIMGDLVVRGNTTTISSTNIDISDIKLTLASASGSDSSLGSGGGIELGNGYASMLWDSALQRWKFNKGVDISGGISTKISTITLGSGNTGDFWHGGGILLGNDAYASMKWNYYTQRWSFNKGIDVSGGMTIDGNMTTTTSAIKIPATLSNYRITYYDVLPASLDPSGLQATGVWHDISGWSITFPELLSVHSRIKFEARIAFTSSPEADQTLSIRVMRLDSSGIYQPACTDLSLGSNMGVSINGVHHITFYDIFSRPTNVNMTPPYTPIGYATFKLQLMRNCPANDTISTPFGVQYSTGNFMSLQELYTPAFVSTNTGR